MYPKSELIKVAKLYYEVGLTQQQIAQKLLHSRPTISRMLDAALKTGIVKVTIQYSLDSVYELEQEIKNTFNLKKVFVAPSYIEVSSLINKDVGKELANYLTELCRSGDVLGVSWGTTLSYVSEALTQTKIDRMKIVQLNGGIAKNSFSTGSIALLQHFAEAFSAEFHLLSVPTIVDSQEIVKALLFDSSIKETINLGKEANIALFGVGRTSYESVLYKGGYFKGNSYEDLIAKGAVGDICSRYFDIEGNIVDSDLNSRTIGLQLEELKKKDHSIALAIGAEKVNAVLGALRGGYINTLFIDEELAKGLLKNKGVVTNGSSEVI